MEDIIAFIFAAIIILMYGGGAVGFAYIWLYGVLIMFQEVYKRIKKFLGI
jgi:hypothetical protein